MDRLEEERVRAIARLARGESPEAICASLRRSERWLYKWQARAREGGEAWYEERSRKPLRMPRKTMAESERRILQVRVELEREGLFCGAQAIVWELEEQSFSAPSVATVNRILKANGVMEREPRRRVPKGKKYPAPAATAPNHVHQADFVGPRYLRGGVRFYVLNTTDVVTARVASTPLESRTSETVVSAVWSAWCRLGIPDVLQIDNDLVFWGSRRHPRAVGQVMRLCLVHGVEPLFIPPAEPWRNGTVEKFNDHWQQKFLGRTELSNFDELLSAAAAFEAKHNSRWRYAKTGGTPPNEALRRTNSNLRFPSSETPPPLPIRRPSFGRFHLVRFIRSDRLLDLFGERHTLPPVAAYEYVTATADLTRGVLSVDLDGTTIAEYDYRH